MAGYILISELCLKQRSYSVGSYVTYNTFVQLAGKIDFSLDSDSKYYENQEKKGLHFLIGR